MMFGLSVAGVAVWYLVFGCLTLLTGGLYVYGRTRGHPDHSLARYQSAVGALAVLSGLLLAVEFVIAILAEGLWILVTTSVAGLDLLYFVLGALLVASGSVLAHARWGTPEDGTPVVRHTKLLGSVFVVSLAFLVAYAVLASAGWVTLLTVMFGDRAEAFGSLESFYPHAEVEAGDQVWELSSDEQAIPETFTHHGTTIDTESHLEATGTTGLIVAQNETIVHESYYQGYDESSRATSWSASKSITSALAGIAIEEGDIDSVEDPVSKYVSELDGSTYGDVTVRQLLTMSSGIEWEESGSPTAELPHLFPNAYGSGQSWRDQMGQYDRAFEPGQYHRYASADTIVLSLVIQDATGQSLSEYLETKIWQPAGMAGDATWQVDSEGAEIGMCCFNAQLRDYTRFGLLFLNDGVHDGEQIVPAEWVNASTSPQPPGVWRDDSRSSDYGYKWWIPRDSDHEYIAEGLYGQYIYVNTQADVVITKTSTDGGVEETLSLFRAITDDVTD